MWLAYAALGPARCPRDRGGAGAGGGAAQEPEGGAGGARWREVGMRPPPGGARRLGFSHTEGSGVILEVFKRKQDLDLGLLASILSYALTSW